jgi:hypothetical protein
MPEVSEETRLVVLRMYIVSSRASKADSSLRLQKHKIYEMCLSLYLITLMNASSVHLIRGIKYPWLKKRILSTYYQGSAC